MDNICILCDTGMKECVVWPFLMEYCPNCFTFRVSGVPDSLKPTTYKDLETEFSKQRLCDIVLRTIPNERVTLRFPKFSKETLCNRWYFSINSIDQFLRNINRERSTNWGICNTQITETEMTITMTTVDENTCAIPIPKSLVDAYNDEIHKNVYDESMYRRILFKSVLARYLTNQSR